MKLMAPRKWILQNIQNAIEATDELTQLKSKYNENSSGSAERITALKTQDPEYLAHEYFNKDWSPMYFSNVSDWLQNAKLDFACSANFLDEIDILNFTKDQLGYLNGITDLKFKETAKDFLVNQHFRKDYWVRGKLNLSKVDRIRQIRDLQFIPQLIVATYRKRGE